VFRRIFVVAQIDLAAHALVAGGGELRIRVARPLAGFWAYIALQIATLDCQATAKILEQRQAELGLTQLAPSLRDTDERLVIGCLMEIHPIGLEKRVQSFSRPPGFQRGPTQVEESFPLEDVVSDVLTSDRTLDPKHGDDQA
jgi:hypothetical protein